MQAKDEQASVFNCVIVVLILRITNSETEKMHTSVTIRKKLIDHIVCGLYCLEGM